MKIIIEIECMAKTDPLPNWKELQEAVMKNMPQLYPFGIVAQKCTVEAILTMEESKRVKKEKK